MMSEQGSSWGRWPRGEQQIVPAVEPLCVQATCRPVIALRERAQLWRRLSQPRWHVACHPRPRPVHWLRPDHGHTRVRGRCPFCRDHRARTRPWLVLARHPWNELRDCWRGDRQRCTWKKSPPGRQLRQPCARIRIAALDGQILHCSTDNLPEWFHATIGGLGLTGLIRRARLQLRRVPGPWIRGDSHRFAGLPEFFSIARDSDRDYEYTVAWIDCSAKGRGLGRGVFIRGNHAASRHRPPSNRRLRVPFTPPISLINALSLRMFNQLYFHRASAESSDALWHYGSFFYPLDGIREWNRIYGPSGFFQYQCVVPEQCAEEAIGEMLRRIARHGTGSFLAVLKLFGRIPSLGLMSFPRPGVTLALDFPNRDADHVGAARVSGRDHAQRERSRVPGQGCADVAGLLSEVLPGMGTLPQLRRSAIFVVVLAARHGRRRNEANL